MVTLSIIVPVYNTSRYLKRCLDSILVGIDEKTEIIAIDDNSTDNSYEILKEYETKYSNKFILYKNENNGIAYTRNFGIDKANGKYILFVDSDDYISKDLINNINKYIEEDIDIIKFKLEKVNENEVVLEKVNGATFSKVTGEEAFNKLAFSDVLIDSPCVYCFKKDLFTKNNFKFRIDTEHEDFGLIPLVLLKAKSVVSLNLYGYYYLQSTNSITRNEDYSRTLKRFNDALIHYDNMISFLEKEQISIQTKKNVKTYYTNAIILKLKEIKEKDRDIYIEKIKQRNMISNIQVHNIKQFIKKVVLCINIGWYLKLK